MLNSVSQSVVYSSTNQVTWDTSDIDWFIAQSLYLYVDSVVGIFAWSEWICSFLKKILIDLLGIRWYFVRFWDYWRELSRTFDNKGWLIDLMLKTMIFEFFENEISKFFGNDILNL
jgi:hypothetical protein